jgi:hypothetical protein
MDDRPGAQPGTTWSGEVSPRGNDTLSWELKVRGDGWRADPWRRRRVCQNIDSLTDHRALLSQNVIGQLRNLVEGVVVRLHTGRSDVEFKYADVNPRLHFVRANARLNFLGKFHKLIQTGASHYTLEEPKLGNRLSGGCPASTWLRRSTLVREELSFAAQRHVVGFTLEADASVSSAPTVTASLTTECSRSTDDCQRGVVRCRLTRSGYS